MEKFASAALLAVAAVAMTPAVYAMPTASSAGGVPENAGSDEVHPLEPVAASAWSQWATDSVGARRAAPGGWTQWAGVSDDSVIARRAAPSGWTQWAEAVAVDSVIARRNGVVSSAQSSDSDHDSSDAEPFERDGDDNDSTLERSHKNETSDIARNGTSDAREDIDAVLFEHEGDADSDSTMERERPHKVLIRDITRRGACFESLQDCQRMGQQICTSECYWSVSHYCCNI